MGNTSGLIKVVALLCVVLVGGGASFADRVPLPTGTDGKTMSYLENVPPVAQEANQCGPAALESVFRYWGRNDADANSITRALYKPGSRGVLNFTLSQHARALGFWTQMDKPKNDEEDLEQLKGWIRKKVPPIVLLRTGPPWVPNYHFVVLKGFDDTGRVFYANVGKPETHTIDYEEFRTRWKAANHWSLIVCPLERVNWDLDEMQAADLAFSFEKMGRLDLAEQWYIQALNQNPKNEVARFNLANIYLKTKRLAEAKAVYTGLLREKGPWGPASNNLAWIYLQEKRFEDAAAAIEAAFRNGAARQVDMLDTLGLAYYRLTEYGKARECFREALKKIPPENHQALAMIRTHISENFTAQPAL